MAGSEDVGFMSFDRMLFCKMDMLHRCRVKDQRDTLHSKSELIKIADVANDGSDSCGVVGGVELQLVVLLLVSGVDNDFFSIGLIE